MRVSSPIVIPGMPTSTLLSGWLKMAPNRIGTVGERHVTPAGHIFLVNPGEPHTGESAAPDGYVYRTLYPRADLVAQIAEDVGARRLPHFKGAVLKDLALAGLLSRFHQCLTGQGLISECESLILCVLAHLIEHHSENPVAPKPVENERWAVRRARE